MAAVLALAGTNYNPITSADPGNSDTWTAGVYYATSPLGKRPLEQDPEYDELPQKFAGVPGVGTKNLAANGRDIDIQLIFLNTSESAIETARNALITTLRAARFSVTVPGGTARASCRLKRGGFKEIEAFTIGRRFAMLCEVNIRQMGSI